MKEIKLFKDSHNVWLTNKDILETLYKLEADKCDILYIHSSLSFGIPNLDIRKNELMNELYKIILDLNIPTIVMPTFTFSYCNGKVYNRELSKTKMGSLNEYFRKQNGVIRSNDPLMSIAVKGEHMELATNVTTHSIGDNSTFDMIHHHGNTKFLFLGTKIGDCFTYMHYLEWLYGVEYRYERNFRGKSIINGMETQNEYDLFVRYNGILPNEKSYEYEDNMYKKGLALKENIGDSSISIVSESIATPEYKKCLDLDPFYFVKLEKKNFQIDKTFIIKEEMIAL